MGTTRSNVKEVDNRAGSVSTFKAGLCVHLDSNGALTLTAASGSKLGISLGRSLSDTARVAIARKGLGIPILLANGLTPVIGAQVQISTTTGTAVASGTAVNAVYTTGVLTAYDEDGVAIADGVALIDFQGGL
jgi:hypothetical protein